MKQKQPLELVKDLDQDIIAAMPRELFVGAFLSRAFEEIPIAALLPQQMQAEMLNRIMISTWHAAHEEGLITEPVPRKVSPPGFTDGIRTRPELTGPM